MGGILGSIIAAASETGSKALGDNINRQARLDEQQAAADLQMRNSIALLTAQKQAAIDSANQMREAQAARIKSAMPAATGASVNAKYAGSDAAVADADAGLTAAPMTDDQKAVIAQSKQSDSVDFGQDPMTWVKAAISTGDIDPHTVATLAQNDIAARRAEATHKADQEWRTNESEKDRRAAAEEGRKNRDAATARVQAKIDANMPPADTTDEEKRNWVHTYLTNNGSVPRSAPAYVRNAIGTWAAQMGVTPESIAKGTAQQKFDQGAAVIAGHRSGSMAGVEAAMPALAENALTTSSKLGQGQFVPINKLYQMSESQLSNPDLAAFKVAHMALVSEYQQVIARGGTNVTALKEAMHVLDSAQSPDAYRAAVNMVKKEVAINVNAMNSVRAGIGGNHAQTVPNPMQPSGSNLIHFGDLK